MREEEANAALFEILEVPPDASFTEIRRAYRQLKRLYNGDSMALDALSEELGDDRRAAILAEIDRAFEELASRFGESPSVDAPPALSEEIHKRIASIAAFSGPVLREIREGLDVTLDQVSRVTRVGREYLKDIEAENFEALPPPVFLRGYVATYAQYLQLDAQKVAADYMERVEKEEPT